MGNVSFTNIFTVMLSIYCFSLRWHKLNHFEKEHLHTPLGGYQHVWKDDTYTVYPTNLIVCMDSL